MMIQPPISHEQATRLAAFIHSLRPDWDKPGVLDAIGKARERGTAAEVSIAAIRCATSGQARTPAVIAMDGPHWREPDPERRSRPDTQITGRCPKCGRLHPPADPCPPPADRAAAATATGARAAREALAARRDDLCTHGVLARDCADHREPEEQPEETTDEPF